MKENIRFHCNCSKHRSLNALKILGREEILSMIDEDKGAELRCHFCNNEYLITKEELKTLLWEDFSFTGIVCQATSIKLPVLIRVVV